LTPRTRSEPFGQIINPAPISQSPWDRSRIHVEAGLPEGDPGRKAGGAAARD
jgi:hypothetical protein